MITGIGTDVVDIDRIDGVYSRWGDQFLDRVFEEEEKEYCLTRPHAEAHLAGRFAAKEAFRKAVGGSASLGDVWVVSGKSGPQLRWSENLDLHISNAHVSISHDAGVAQAFVVVEE